MATEAWSACGGRKGTGQGRVQKEGKALMGGPARTALTYAHSSLNYSCVSSCGPHINESMHPACPPRFFEAPPFSLPLTPTLASLQCRLTSPPALPPLSSSFLTPSRQRANCAWTATFYACRVGADGGRGGWEVNDHSIITTETPGLPHGQQSSLSSFPSLCACGRVDAAMSAV
jgi:hypothetical protein